MVDLVLRKFTAEHPKATISEKAKAMLKGQAEGAKKALSNQRSAQVMLSAFAVDRGEPIDLELLITRDEYEQEVTSLLDRARTCVRTALTAGQLKPSAIDRVLLVGGTTYMPCVRRLVAELFNKEPKVDPNVHPDTAVTTGAAVQAALAAKMVTGFVVADGSPFGIGIDVKNSYTDRLEYSELMAPNTKIPYSVKKNYSLLSPKQENLNIKVYQDHSTRTLKLEDKTDSRIEARITNIPHSLTDSPHDLEVSFSYDINGLIILEAHLPATKQKLALKFDKTLSSHSSEDQADSKKQVNDLWKQSPTSARYDGLISRANAAAESADPAARAKIQASVARLKDAIQLNDEAAIKATSDALTDLLFDLQDAA
jgi:molecular chaperone DnaK